MLRAPFIKSLIVIVTAGGLAVVTIFTATAASESSPGDSVDRTWVWHGTVGVTDHVDLPLILATGLCGRWPLEASDGDAEAALRAHVGGDPILVIGRVTKPTEADRHPSIAVERIALDRSELQEGDKLFPGCVQKDRHKRPQPKAREKSRAGLAPDLLSVLQRFGLKDLHEIPVWERFDHFIGGEVSYVDGDGVVVSISVIVGTAVSATDEELELDVNGPAGVETLVIGEETIILRPGGGDGSDIEVGDKVLAVLRDGSETLAIIASDQVKLWPGQGGAAASAGAMAVIPGLHEFAPGLNGALPNLAAELRGRFQERGFTPRFFGDQESGTLGSLAFQASPERGLRTAPPETRRSR